MYIVARDYDIIIHMNGKPEDKKKIPKKNIRMKESSGISNLQKVDKSILTKRDVSIRGLI